MTTEATADDEGEHTSRRAVGYGNYKEYVHANGSQKIIWVWACGITSLFCAVIGAVVLLAWSEQGATNREVAAELKTLAVEVAKLQATVAAQERQ